MMHQWVVQQDRIWKVDEVDYLGIPYDLIRSGEAQTLPQDYDGWFPFMRMCYSLGDLAIVSGLFEALKQKYPKIKIAWPSNDCIKHILGESMLKSFEYNTKANWIANIETVFKNNPYIDKVFEVGEFDKVFTDHDRSYIKLVHDGEVIRSSDEPLAEQILRRFGFTDHDIVNIDSTPKLYFTDKEIQKCESIISKHIGTSDYGCLLFAGRLERFKGRWENDYLLYEDAERFKDTPVFYFSEYDLNNTEWADFFPKRYDFAQLNLSIREQIYIKRHAKFNIGYQGGVTEASSGGSSEMISLSPYNTIRENCIRGSKYIFFDKTNKII